MKPKRVDTKSGRHYEVGEKKLPSITTIIDCIGKPALINWAAKVERELVAEVSGTLYFRTIADDYTYLNPEGWQADLEELLGKEKAHKKLLSKASDIGTQVHARIDWMLRQELWQEEGSPPELNEAAQLAFQSWLDWRAGIELTPIAIEQKLWSDVHNCAGTLDLLAKLNGPVTAKDYFTDEPVTIECDNTLAVIDWKSGKAVYPESFLQNAAYRSMARERLLGNPEYGLIVRLPKVATDPNFEVIWCPPEEESMEIFLHTLELFKWLKKYHKWPKKEKVAEDLE